MNALDSIKQSIDTKQKELTRILRLGEFSKNPNRTNPQVDSSDINCWSQHQDGYGDIGYGDGWQDYTISN